MLDEVGIVDRPTLLIADDDSDSRLKLHQELSERFEVVALAADAEGAIALARDYHPDLALVDAHIPGGGAIRATTEISRLSPETAICAISTDELEHEVLDILLAGAEAYTLKGRGQYDLEHMLFGSLRAHWAAGSLAA